MNNDQIIEYLSNLVKFDTSINPSKGIFPSNNCSNFIIEQSSKFGFENISPIGYYANDSNTPLYPVLLVKRGAKPGNNILFLGHIDVVPVTKIELEKWDHPPFEPTLEEGELLGRGSGDMKGGVTAFFAAFNELDIEYGNLIIALSGDEEIGGKDTVPIMIEKLKDLDLLPNFVINAEGAGSNVIVTKRRGGTQFSLKFDLDYHETIGDKQTKLYYSSLGNDGKGLHSMSYLPGSSIHAMITAGVETQDKKIIFVKSSSTKANSVPYEVEIQYINGNEKTGTKITYSQGLTKLMNALASIYSIPLPITKSKYGVSLCPNLIEIDEENSIGIITFDIRSMLVNKDSHDELIQNVIEHFDFFGLKTETSIDLKIDPVNVPEDHYLAKVAFDLCAQKNITIKTVGEKLGGASDTRYFTSLGIPGIELGPLSTNAHGINESVNLSSIYKLKEIFRELYLILSSHT